MVNLLCLESCATSTVCWVGDEDCNCQLSAESAVYLSMNIILNFKT